MDKVAIKFFADVMYVKGIICWQEFNDMMEVSTLSDLDAIIERMLNDGYNVYLRGETYVRDNYPNVGRKLDKGI